MVLYLVTLTDIARVCQHQLSFLYTVGCAAGRNSACWVLVCFDWS